ncbi:hypothetical protein Tco_0442526 [Tanacetum coccineum]
MNQELRKQEVLLAAQREQELLVQKQAAKEKQFPSPNSVFRQVIEETVYNNFKVIHNENIIPLNKMPQISSSIALAPVFSIMEPEDSLSMGDEHLNTIPKKELDEFIKSSVEDLSPIPKRV